MEAMKRDSEIDEERAHGEADVARVRQQVEAGREFIASIKKEVVKLMKQVEKKQAEYGGTEEEINTSAA
jgi:hypothetical protein